MASGRGATLGEALVELFGGGVRRSSYDRQGWRAQFAQLSGTRAGYAALERAGLSATTRTQRGWLSGDVEASPANQSRIAEAYQAMAGGWNRRFETAQINISGRLTQGPDSRERGFGRSQPLRLQYPGDPLINWRRIREAYEAGAESDEIEQLFVEDVVTPILGEGSYPWEFDGDRYEVTA